MVVLTSKNGDIVATYSINISGHYDPERWDRDKIREFIEEKMQLLRDKVDIVLLQINGDRIDVVVYVSEPDMPPHIIGRYAYLWMMTNNITGQNGLFVDKIDITECDYENSMYLVVGHYACAEQNSYEPGGANPT